LANEIVIQNRPVDHYYITGKDLNQLSLRKPPKFFSKPIRLIDIKDFDLDPCGGTHVRNTGEVGLIKILSWEKVRNNLRCTFVAGKRALYQFQNKTIITQKINQILSTTDDESIELVESLKLNMKSRDKQIKKLKQQLLQLEVDKLIEVVREKNPSLFTKEFTEKDSNEIRSLAVEVSKRVPTITAFYSSENPAYFVMSCDDSSTIDFTPLIPNLRDLFQAKGGGNATFFELNFINPAQIPQAFVMIDKFLKMN
jgi:alanyl-tRNA synthetase